MELDVATGQAADTSNDSAEAILEDFDLATIKYAEMFRGAFADARTDEDPEVFHLGDGRSFYGGVSWSW